MEEKKRRKIGYEAFGLIAQLFGAIFLVVAFEPMLNPGMMAAQGLDTSFTWRNVVWIILSLAMIISGRMVSKESEKLRKEMGEKADQEKHPKLYTAFTIITAIFVIWIIIEYVIMDSLL